MTFNGVKDDHEQVIIRQDRDSGMRFVVAVHSTVLGPALGGLRLKPYPGGLSEALDDALALARTMTLKASAAGLELGGGKAVMIDDGRADLRERRLELAAEVVDGLGGAYITAEDIGTTTSDMDLIAEHTRYVVGRSTKQGGGGDPSPVTARTVLEAIRRGLCAATDSVQLEGRRVGVVGLGKVGGALAASLASAGARVVACDLVPERVERIADEYGAEPVASAEELMAQELDVLAPCDAGGLIDDTVANGLRCRVVAGAANNPLTGTGVAIRLARRGVLYVPDFLANCGGLIHVNAEWRGFDSAAVDHCVERAMDGLSHVLSQSRRTGLAPLEVAERDVLARIEAARRPLVAVA
jgi:glutamate dehydrogenase/leucine dehydrogenase